MIINFTIFTQGGTTGDNLIPFLHIYKLYLWVPICICRSISVYLSICLPIYICLFIDLSIYMSDLMYLFICVCLSIFVCISVYLSVCIFLWVLPSLSIYLSVYIYLHLSIYISTLLRINILLSDIPASSSKTASLHQIQNDGCFTSARISRYQDTSVGGQTWGQLGGDFSVYPFSIFRKVFLKLKMAYLQNMILSTNI